MPTTARAGRRSTRCWRAARNNWMHRGTPESVILRPISSRAHRQDPYLGRELRSEYGIEVGDRCGPEEVDMMAIDEGANSWGPRYRLQTSSAFECPLPTGFDQVSADSHPWGHWFSKLGAFGAVRK